MAHGHDQIAGLHAGFKGGTVVEWGSDQCTSGIRRNGNADSRERALHFLDEFVTVPGGDPDGVRIARAFHHPLDGALSEFFPGEFSDEFRLQGLGDFHQTLRQLCPVGSLGECRGQPQHNDRAGKKHQNGGPTGSQSEVLPRG